MNRTLISICFGILSILSSSVSAQTITGTVNEDMFIVISGTVDLLGVDVQSPGGHIIPVPGGVPDPFDVLVTNTPNEVLFGSVGISNAVTLDGELVLGAQYDGGEVFDLIGSWGGPANGQEGPITFTQTAFPTIPEPNAGLLASFGLLSLLAIRTRRAN